MGYEPLNVVEITVAHATRDIPNPDLVRSGLLQFEHLDLEALTGLVVNRRLDLHGHAMLSPATKRRAVQRAVRAIGVLAVERHGPFDRQDIMIPLRARVLRTRLSTRARVFRAPVPSIVRHVKPLNLSPFFPEFYVPRIKGEKTGLSDVGRMSVE